jgi:hypothetical protein
MPDRKFDAFISYSHKDSGQIAPLIQTGIENIGRPWYRIGRTLNLFRDETNLSAAPELWPNIEGALYASHYFILFASPIAATSKWVKKEIGVWIERNYTVGKGLEKIFIVVTAGKIDWPDDATDFDWDKTSSCLPKDVLAGKFRSVPNYVDLRPYVTSNENGLQVDYKAAGFTTAMTKIIGAITGKDPREIESAELRRSRNTRRFLAGIGLVLAGLFVASLILYSREVKANMKAAANLKALGLEQLSRNIRNGDVYLDAGEYCLAKGEYTRADSITRKYPDDYAILQVKPIVTLKLDSCNKLCHQ